MNGARDESSVDILPIPHPFASILRPDCGGRAMIGMTRAGLTVDRLLIGDHGEIAMEIDSATDTEDSRDWIMRGLTMHRPRAAVSTRLSRAAAGTRRSFVDTW
jgi:hypothetical protein